MKSIPFDVEALQRGRELAEAGAYQGRAETWAVLASIGLILFILELIRRGQLKERYSLLWFATAVVVLVLSWQREWLEALAAGLGIYYAPSALFLVFFGFVVLILIHFSTVISRLLKSQQILTQKMGVLESQMRDLKSETPDRSPIESE